MKLLKKLRNNWLKKKKLVWRVNWENKSQMAKWTQHVSLNRGAISSERQPTPPHPPAPPTMSSTPAGTTMGLKDSEWGQMGVTMMAGTLGWIMEAPAAAAYAVLPVGVDTITPGGEGVWGGGNRDRRHSCSLTAISDSPTTAALSPAPAPHRRPAPTWWVVRPGTGPRWTGRRRGLGPPPPRSTPGSTHTHTQAHTFITS